MVLCGTVSSFLTSKMVELVGVEPMTYTMRTYSFKLKYCNLVYLLVAYFYFHAILFCQTGINIVRRRQY